MYKNFSSISKTSIRADLLIGLCLGISKNQAAKYCEKGLVKVNNKIVKSGFHVIEKSKISIKEKIEEIIPGNSKLNIKIAYEDTNLIILEKPRDIHCVRRLKDEKATIADFLADYCKSTINATDNTKESGLINRLDFQTSGLIIAAKNKNAAKELKELQSKKEITKTYQALVRNKPRIKIIESGFKHKKDSTVELSITEKNYKTEITKIDKIENEIYLLQITGSNFYRHQIRAHLSSIGSALIGDKKYNSDSITEKYFLHSLKLQLKYKAKLIEVSSEKQLSSDLT